MLQQIDLYKHYTGSIFHTPSQFADFSVPFVLIEA